MTTNTRTLLKSSASSFAIVFAISAGAAQATTLPGHGSFVSGHGAIAKNGGRMTISQTSATGIIDWKTFSVGKGNAVVFQNGKGATLNEVTGGNLSRIDGSLTSTGSVYLINSAGVLVSSSGRIDTQGSFAASGGSADDGAFSDGHGLRLLGKAKGNVVNEGAIQSGGNVSLNGHDVSDSGSVSARNASLLATDTTTVTGKITAQQHDGSGGNIETSGETLNLGHAKISGHTWLVDPKSLTVTSTAASTIDSSLTAGTSVVLKTTATTTSGPGTASTGAGDITIASALAWTGTAKLTLDAYHSVIIDDPITSKSKGGLAIKTDDGGAGGDLLFGSAGYVTFDNNASALSIGIHSYTLESSIASLATAIAAHPAGYYALAKSITSTGTYTSSPIPTTFTGAFEGLGNSITNLSINDSADGYVGLFSNASGTLRDINLVNANVVGLDEYGRVGTLVGYDTGTLAGDSASGKVVGGYDGYIGGLVGESDTGVAKITNSHASTRVTGGDDYEYTGGLAGYSGGTITNSYATGAVTGGYYADIGGLVGYNEGTITGSYATGAVNADYWPSAGGLVGYNDGGTISSSYATGDVNGGYAEASTETDGYGGLVGYSKDGSITSSKATGDVTGDYYDYAGGLVGYAYGTTVSSSYATGDVNAGSDGYAGGLVGYTKIDGSHRATITSSHASGNVTSGYEGDIGGLVGESYDGIANSYATGDVTAGYDSEAGGLVGYNASKVQTSYAKGNVSGGYDSDVGGLIGYDDGTGTISSYATGNVSAAYESEVGGLDGESDSAVSASYATGNVTGGYEDDTGGLVGYADSGSITTSHASGHVAGESYYVGGLVGENDAAITKSYATGDVDGTSGSYVGGLVGYNDDTIATSFATGAVTSSDGYYAGGLVGENDGAIINTYATGAVSGYDSDLGGLIGYNNTSAPVKYSYSTGAARGADNSYIYGFIGDNADTNAGDFVSDYWDTSSVPGLTGAGGTLPAAVVGKTTAQLKAAIPSGFSGTTWGISSTINSGLPYLKGVTP